MNAPTITYTGFSDEDNVPINVGDVVQSPEGLIGKVVFANGAYRVDVTAKYSGDYLRRNSSLMFCDRWTPEEFKVIG